MDLISQGEILEFEFLKKNENAEEIKILEILILIQISNNKFQLISINGNRFLKKQFSGEKDGTIKLEKILKEMNKLNLKIMNIRQICTLKEIDYYSYFS